MELTELPESMLVIGGNAVGLELAQLFARLKVTVTVAEALDRLAPFDEPEISAAIEDVFEDEGIGILTAASVVSAGRDAARSVTIKTARCASCTAPCCAGSSPPGPRRPRGGSGRPLPTSGWTPPPWTRWPPPTPCTW